MRIIYAVLYVFLLRNILYLQLQLSYFLNSFSSPALIIKISNLYSPFSLSDSKFFSSDFLPIWLRFKGASVNCESKPTRTTLLIQVAILTV